VEGGEEEIVSLSILPSSCVPVTREQNSLNDKGSAMMSAHDTQFSDFRDRDVFASLMTCFLCLNNQCHQSDSLSPLFP
jgi:hypothetical protein